MEARESETTVVPVYMCWLSYSLDTYQRMWAVSTLQNRHTCSQATVFSRNAEACVYVHALPADVVLAPQELHTCQTGRVEAVPK